MEQWISKGLERVLGFEIPEEMVQYIVSIDSEPDFNEYMKTLLDFDNSQHRNFFTELVQKKFPKANPPQQGRQKKKISKDKQPQQEFVTAEPPPKSEEPESEQKEGKGKKKTKFVNLYSKEGQRVQVVRLKGRHRCDCEAYEHELINNCLSCGRIVCTQEGSGPCFFCGELVCTPDEQKEINSNSKSGAALKDQLMEQERPEGWEEAIAYRNRLLDYQDNRDQRSTVIDDDSDYFNTNTAWLSPEERAELERYRQELHDKRHALRSSKPIKLTFDFAGRQIKEEKEEEVTIDLERIKQIRGEASFGAEAPEQQFQNDMLVEGRYVAPGVNPELVKFNPEVEKEQTDQKREKEQEQEEQSYSAVTKAPRSTLPFSRVQDAGIQEMCDTGKCLSLHQPWASLLVEGIKLHEGRSWYTSHRGRLWIASTAKPPDDHIVRQLENQYRVLYPDKNLKFPSFYPTGCLLGCVNLDDVLPQEEYAKEYPDGESDSPYVFICSRPISLRIRFPIKGQHKIYQLDKIIHRAAAQSIMRMSKAPTEEGTG